ncbi:MAG: SpoIIE family protein phosphatase [Cyclobacteriaceae bacterium]
MNLYIKLTLICLFLVVVSGSTLFYFTNNKYQNALKEEISSSVWYKANQSVNDIYGFITARVGELTTIAGSSELTSPDQSSDAISGMLRNAKSSNRYLQELMLYDLNDELIASTGSSDNPNPIKFWGNLTDLSPSAANISLDKSNNPVIKLATAVRQDGEISSVLVTHIPLQELRAIANNISIGDDQERTLSLELIDSKGLVLFSSVDQKAALKTRLNNFDEIKNIGSGQELTYHKTDESVYVVARKKQLDLLTSEKWTMVLSAANEVVFAPLDKIKNQLIWVIIPVLLVSIVLALIAAHNFVKPIARLSEVASEMGKGNFELDIKVSSKNEVGILAAELQRASETLNSRIEDQRDLNRKLEEQKNEISIQKEQIEESNQQMKDSISYARRIQGSLLPDISGLQRFSKDAMVYYKPKDIVSGDFYWFERVRKGRNDYLIIACADCTGHGVPGAIMSIMGSNQLTNIVYYQNYLEPKKIIARLDKAIKFELYREEDKDKVKKDGMEIGVCVISLDDLSMEFAGVGIPLYLVRENNLEIVKAVKAMAGGMTGEERDIENQLSAEKIQLSVGDKIYMASDGFQDQFGGKQDKKFMVKKFRDLLLDTSKESMTDQAKKIEEEYEAWKQDTPQTDDVCVIGVEIN